MSNRTPDTVLAELQPIFQEALESPEAAVTRASSAANTSNWDSLAQMAIIEMVESHFTIRLSLGELQDLKDVGGLVDLIVAKTAA
jgi:acyl carrier protein